MSKFYRAHMFPHAEGPVREYFAYFPNDGDMDDPDENCNGLSMDAADMLDFIPLKPSSGAKSTSMPPLG